MDKFDEYYNWTTCDEKFALKSDISDLKNY